MSINNHTNGNGNSASNAISDADNKIKMVIDKPNQFPRKLYDMLETAQRRGEEHIISWIRDGTAFRVHNRDVFIEEYMKKMFNQTKFKSFQRQLNLWGFERIQTGSDKGSYYHPLFIKGQKDCCQRLTRVRLKGAPPLSSETKHTNTNEGVRAFFHEQEAPTMLAGNGIGAPIVVGGSTAEFSAAVAMGVSLTPVAAPIHGFTGLESAQVSSIEATLRGSSHQQSADLLRYQHDNQRREILAAAPAGLGPDVAPLLAPSAPLYATTDRSTLVVNGLLQHQLEMAQQRQQEEEMKQVAQEEKHHGGNFRHHEDKMPPPAESGSEQIPPASLSNGHGPSNGSSSRSDEMAALLAVSAQRRREEELALLLELSKPKGVDV